MQNKTLIFAARLILMDLLFKCTEDQVNFFKDMYIVPSSKRKEIGIVEAVQSLDPEKLDPAITQAENSLRKTNELNNLKPNTANSFDGWYKII